MELELSPFMQRQLRLYAEKPERWKLRHNEAMACYELDDVLSFGIYLFTTIRQRDTEWSEQVRSGEKTYSADDARKIGDMYRSWYQPCPELLKAIELFERDDYELVHAKRFKKCCEETQLLTSFNVDRVASAMARVSSGDASKRRSASEALDELHSRVRRRGD